MISYARLVDDTAEHRIASLAPLAVAPDRQKQGIGSALVRESLAIADERGEPLVVLQGAPAYYSRFGFEPASAFGIQMDLPSWAPPEAAQVCRLVHYDASIRGRVVNPPAFDVVDHD
jgi:putative acetyltransferase